MQNLLKSKIIKITCLVVVMIILLLLLLNSIISYLGKKYINDNGQDLIGREIVLDDLQFNLFNGKLSLSDLLIKEADNNATFASVKSFDTNISLPYLLTGTVKLKSFDVTGFVINVIQSDTIFNFSDILDYFDNANEEEADSPDSFPLVIDDIKIRNSFFHFKNIKSGTYYNLNNYSLRIPGVDLRNINNNSATLKFVEGGSLSTLINYNQNTRYFDVKLALDGFNLAGLLPFVQQYANASGISGSLSSNLSIKGNLENLLSPDIKGDATISSFILSDKQDDGIFNADSVKCIIKNIDILRNLFELSDLSIDKPSLKYILNKDSIDNFTLLMETKSVSSLDENITDDISDSDVAPANIVIDYIKVTNGRVIYRDETFKRNPFEYLVYNINVRSNNFNLNKRNRVSLSASLNSSGQAKLLYDGKIDDISNSELSVNIENLPIKDFSPYSLQLFAYPLSGGTLSLKSSTSIVNNQLSGENNIIVNKPSVEDKDKSITPEYKMPLKFGIYCLTDKNGVCNMDLPVSGDLQSPEFSYKKALFKVLGQFLGKVASTPFRKIGGKSDDDSDLIHFGSITSEINQDEISRIDTLSNILINNEEMNLSIVLNIDKNSAIEECTKLMVLRDYLINNNHEAKSVDLVDADQHQLLLIDIKSPEFVEYIDNIVKEKSIPIENNTSIEEKISKIYSTDAVLLQVESFINKRVGFINDKFKSYGLQKRVLVSYELINSKKLIGNYYNYNFEEN